MNKAIVAFLLLVAIVLFGCVSPKNETNQSAQIANPASVYCINHSGNLSIVTDAKGNQIGICTLPNGTKCEEWSFYRTGNCTENATLVINYPPEENETNVTETPIEPSGSNFSIEITGMIAEFNHQCVPEFDANGNVYAAECGGTFCNALSIDSSGKLACKSGETPENLAGLTDCQIGSYPPYGPQAPPNPLCRSQIRITTTADCHSSDCSPGLNSIPIRWAVRYKNNNTYELFGSCEFYIWAGSDGKMHGKFVSSSANAPVGSEVSWGSISDATGSSQEVAVPVGKLLFLNGTVEIDLLHKIADTLDKENQSSMDSLTVDAIEVGACADGTKWSTGGIIYCDSLSSSKEIPIPSECAVTIPINGQP